MRSWWQGGWLIRFTIQLKNTVNYAYESTAPVLDGRSKWHGGGIVIPTILQREFTTILQRAFTYVFSLLKCFRNVFEPLFSRPWALWSRPTCIVSKGHAHNIYDEVDLRFPRPWVPRALYGCELVSHHPVPPGWHHCCFMVAGCTHPWSFMYGLCWPHFPRTYQALVMEFVCWLWKVTARATSNGIPWYETTVIP